MRTLGIIPARYASTRFPGKPLAKIGNKTMIELTYGQALKASSLNEVIVATDDSRIFDCVGAFGGKAVMTSPLCRSGTDRAAEALAAFEGFDAVVNIQGDEPFIQPEQINLAAGALAQSVFPIITLAKRLLTFNEIFNPNTVKVVFDLRHKALYFSRHPLPYVRDAPPESWPDHFSYFKHIGLYAYRIDALQALAQIPESRLEKAESLEQLRWLESGYAIGIVETDMETIGIDAPEDLLKINCR